jgi:transglutaminase-like putative cysteine protease
MAKFKIEHTTRYTYEQSVRDSANQVMLYPLEDEFQEVITHKLSITGNPSVEIHTDTFNNKIGTFTHSHPHQLLIISSKVEVQTHDRKLPDDSTAIAAQWAELDQLKNKISFIEFLKLEKFEHLSDMQSATGNIDTKQQTPLQCVNHFCLYVFKNFEYKKGITTVETTLDEIWKIKSGVCQDFAHMLLALMRVNKIPARYVSGYICPNKNGMRGEGATHAWVEAYIPFYGWLGIDPTNNCLVTENHVRLAVGKNFSDCSPVRGTYRGTSNHTLEVSVSVGYENGVTDSSGLTSVEPISSFSKNSFQRHQEMQMQQ